MWGPGAVLVLVYVVGLCVLVGPMMIVQAVLGRAAFLVTAPMQLVLQPLTLAWMLAAFAWAEGDVEPIGALQRGWAIVRGNVGEALKIAVVIGGISTVLSLPAMWFQPDLLALLRDPVGYQPPIPPFLGQLLLLPSMVVALWGWLAAAAVHRTQPRPAKEERLAG
jgi:hypothetical protein